MSASEAGLRRPATTWEYAVSAADQLLLWGADSTSAGLRQPVRVQAVVLLAAAVTDQARARHLEGTAVTDVSLQDLERTVRHHAASLLEACAAPAGTGGEEAEQLLAAYGNSGFEAVWQNGAGCPAAPSRRH